MHQPHPLAHGICSPRNLSSPNQASSHLRHTQVQLRNTCAGNSRLQSTLCPDHMALPQDTLFHKNLTRSLRTRRNPQTLSLVHSRSTRHLCDAQVQPSSCQLLGARSVQAWGAFRPFPTNAGSTSVRKRSSTLIFPRETWIRRFTSVLRMACRTHLEPTEQRESGLPELRSDALRTGRGFTRLR